MIIVDGLTIPMPCEVGDCEHFADTIIYDAPAEANLTGREPHIYTCDVHLEQASQLLGARSAAPESVPSSSDDAEDWDE